MSSYFKYSFTLLLAFFLISCGEQEPERERPREVDGDELLKANRQLVARERDKIESYVGRRGWGMEKTGSGLWYEVYEKGSGEGVEQGMNVKIDYKVSLLDGTVCYSSREDGYKTFRVGHSDIEAGLEEGVLMLAEGDKARFVLPSYLAHGLIGDQKKIPPRAVIVYELEVLSVD